MVSVSKACYCRPLGYRSVAAGRGKRAEVQHGTRVAAEHAVFRVDDCEGAADARRAILSIAVRWTHDPGQCLRGVPASPGKLLVADLVSTAHDAYGKRVRRVERAGELVDKEDTIACVIDG